MNPAKLKQKGWERENAYYAWWIDWCSENEDLKLGLGYKLLVCVVGKCECDREIYKYVKFIYGLIWDLKWKYFTVKEEGELKKSPR